MPLERFYLDHSLENGCEVVLEANEFHHLAHVMRIAEGETIELINGRGILALAKVSQLKKREAKLIIHTSTKYPPKSNRIILAQGLPRTQKLDFILEKGTELGVSEFWLFPAEKGEKRQLTEDQLRRAKQLTISAIKQCGTLYLPSIQIKPPIRQWESVNYPALFGDVDPHAPPILTLLESIQSLIFTVGPESGFSEQEVSHLKALGMRGVKLNSNILRTETASIAALAVIGAALL